MLMNYNIMNKGVISLFKKKAKEKSYNTKYTWQDNKTEITKRILRKES